MPWSGQGIFAYQSDLVIIGSPFTNCPNGVSGRFGIQHFVVTHGISNNPDMECGGGGSQLDKCCKSSILKR